MKRILYYNNATAHMRMFVKCVLARIKTIVLEQPSYSSAMAPASVFLEIKETLMETNFEDNDDVKHSMMAAL